jgi:ABC-type nickel/cobalt efflux system permease component RcnA
VALGAAGGLYPSPSALVVLVSAFTLGRAGLGLALVAAFSIGLAATLTAVGVALVYGRGVIERHRWGRAGTAAGLVSAAVIVALGVWFFVSGLREVR